MERCRTRLYQMQNGQRQGWCCPTVVFLSHTAITHRTLLFGYLSSSDGAKSTQVAVSWELDERRTYNVIVHPEGRRAAADCSYRLRPGDCRANHVLSCTEVFGVGDYREVADAEMRWPQPSPGGCGRILIPPTSASSIFRYGNSGKEFQRMAHLQRARADF
jgi:hypothetical protein